MRCRSPQRCYCGVEFNIYLSMKLQPVIAGLSATADWMDTGEPERPQISQQPQWARVGSKEPRNHDRMIPNQWNGGTALEDNTEKP